jgi:hypothetical protein
MVLNLVWEFNVRHTFLNCDKVQFSFPTKKKKKKKNHGLSPRANYTDRATAACRRSDCQLLRNLGFLDRCRYFFYQVAPQLYSRGWVDPVLGPLLFFLVVPGIEPGPPDLLPRTLTTRPQSRSFFFPLETAINVTDGKLQATSYKTVIWYVFNERLGGQ